MGQFQAQAKFEVNNQNKYTCIRGNLNGSKNHVHVDKPLLVQYQLAAVVDCRNYIIILTKINLSKLQNATQRHQTTTTKPTTTATTTTTK